MRVSVLITCLLCGLSAQAQETLLSDISLASAEHCSALRENAGAFPAKIMAALGDWESCELTQSEDTEYGTYSETLIMWKSATLRIENQAPETRIYTLDARQNSPLTSGWFETHKTQLIDKFFDMNWNYDEFPGPRAEHYVSSEAGTNAQFWVERNADGHVTWMQFSYAL